MTYTYEKKISRAEENLLFEAHGSYLIGRLSDTDFIITGRNHISFMVRALCENPIPVHSIYILSQYVDNESYIGFDSAQYASVLPPFYDAYGEDVNGRCNELDEYMGGKLIIFHPEYNFSEMNGKWYKNLHITGYAKDDLDLYGGFEAVPRTNLKPSKFEAYLENGEYFDLLEYDGLVSKAPKIVMCGNYVYRVCDESMNSVLTCNPNSPQRWKCNDYNQVKKIDMSSFESAKKCVIRACETIEFVELNLLSDILICKDYEMSEKAKSLVALTSGAEEMTPEPDHSVEIEENPEMQFLKGLQQMTMDNGLQYKFEDLVNFHVSVKTNPLTILAGMTGTGKSRLAMNYAKMLNLSEDNGTLLFMPVSPSYTEPGDVLGYLNSMNGLYVPSETGLVQFLNHAEKNPDRMHMVIFDEMNLSQIEYWFSPFISILEKDKKERILKIYDEDAHCINEKIYPSTIRIGENVIFVGTVNLDDTTKVFSDRLLDRTFIINLGKLSFKDLYAGYMKNQSEKEKSDVSTARCSDVSMFASWCHGDDLHYLDVFRENPEQLAFFDDLNDLIGKYTPEGGVSYRVMKNIGNYLLNIPKQNGTMVLDEKVVFDVIVNQTVMTKIRGSQSQLDSMIGFYDRETDTLMNSELLGLLDSYSKLSDFTRVKQTLRNKAEELRINGYTD